MKKNLIVLLLTISGLFLSQNTEKMQKFSKLNFQISTPCSLYENTTFKQMAQRKASVAEALVCADNSTVTIYNINIYNEYGGSKVFLNKYATELKHAGINFEGIVIDGIPML